MSHSAHDLAAAFPEAAARLHALKLTDTHFQKLSDAYYHGCGVTRACRLPVRASGQYQEVACRDVRMSGNHGNQHGRLPAKPVRIIPQRAVRGVVDDPVTGIVRLPCTGRCMECVRIQRAGMGPAEKLDRRFHFRGFRAPPSCFHGRREPFGERTRRTQAHRPYSYKMAGIARLRIAEALLIQIDGHP